MIDLDIVMTVPRLAIAMPDLDKADAPFEQPARRQQLAPLHSVAIELPHGRGFARDRKRIRRLHLHAIRELERLDSRLELRFVLPLCGVLCIHGVQQIELGPLVGTRGRKILDMLDQLIDVRVRRIDIVALINPGQKAALPVLRFLNRITVRTHRNISRQVLVFGTEPVRHPRPQTRPWQPGIATIHQHQRRLVIRHVCGHRTDHRDLIDRRGDVREKFTHFDATLAVALKRKR